MDCYRRALEADAEHTEARQALATALSDLGRDDEAIAAFRAVLAAEPDHFEAHRHLGRLLEEKRVHAAAAGHYDMVLAQRPDDVEALLGAARTRRNVGRRTEALELLQRLEELQPDLAAAFSLRGEILAEIGLLDAAATELRRAVALAPERAI